MTGRRRITPPRVLRDRHHSRGLSRTSRPGKDVRDNEQRDAGFWAAFGEGPRAVRSIRRIRKIPGDPGSKSSGPELCELCEFCGSVSERILGESLTIGPRLGLWPSATSRGSRTGKRPAALLVGLSARERLAQASDSQIEVALAHVAIGSTQNDDRTVSLVMSVAISDRRDHPQSKPRLRDQVGPSPITTRGPSVAMATSTPMRGPSFVENA
jgi:hypothetical protein